MLVKARNVFSHSGCAHAITVLDLEGITPKFILIVYIYQSRGVKTAVSCAAFRDNTVVLVVGDRKYGRDGPKNNPIPYEEFHATGGHFCIGYVVCES